MLLPVATAVFYREEEGIVLRAGGGRLRGGRRAVDLQKARKIRVFYAKEGFVMHRVRLGHSDRACSAVLPFYAQPDEIPSLHRRAVLKWFPASRRRARQRRGQTWRRISHCYQHVALLFPLDRRHGRSGVHCRAGSCRWSAAAPCSSCGRKCPGPVGRQAGADGAKRHRAEILYLLYVALTALAGAAACCAGGMNLFKSAVHCLRHGGHGRFRHLRRIPLRRDFAVPAMGHHRVHDRVRCEF